MISAINSSLSGIDASLKRFDTSAHNTANLSTSGFKKDTILQSENGTAAVVVHIEKSLTPGLQLPSPDGSIIEGSNVDLAEEASHQIIARAALGANLAALKSTLEAEKSIIDIIV
ncbi:MAG: hypothetical protein ACE5FY_03700 [Nitrospiria bacterium]